MNGNVPHESLLLRSGFSTSSKEERVKEFLETQDLPDLTSDEIKEISDEGSKVHLTAFS